MRKYSLARVLAALAVALLGVIAIGPSAFAASTSSNGPISVTGDPWPPVAGQPELVTGTVVFANSSTICKVWTLSFDGQTVSGDVTNENHSGNTVTYSHSFLVPSNTPASQGHIANATCTSHDTLGYEGQLDPTLSTAANPLTTNLTIVPGGRLPNTGGPSLWWLIAGILSLLAGAGAVATARHKQHQAL